MVDISELKQLVKLVEKNADSNYTVTSTMIFLVSLMQQIPLVKI